MKTYHVYRIGSNAANQAMCQKNCITILKAHNEGEAVELALQEEKEGKFTLYNNQHLEAIALRDIPKSEKEAEQEDFAMATQLVEGFCMICGKSVGEIEARDSANAYCGCKG